MRTTDRRVGADTDELLDGPAMYRVGQLLALLRRVGVRRKSLRVADLARSTALTEPRRYVVMHFDVERRAAHALEFARRVRDIGLVGSFFFQTRREAYRPDVLRAIADLGHEVGYHYECLDRCKGDYEQARALFLREVARFRRDGIALATVCAHRELGIQRPGYHGNEDLLRRYPELLSEAGGIADAGEIAAPFQIVLALDTYRARWKLCRTLYESDTSDALLYVWMHPHRWHDWDATSLREIGRDLRQYARNWARGARDYEAIRPDRPEAVTQTVTTAS